MKLTGGNYGGYTVINNEVILYDENNDVIDTQSIVIDSTYMVINGWIYNEDGIFVGTE